MPNNTVPPTSTPIINYGFDVGTVVNQINSNWFAKPFLYTIQISGTDPTTQIPINVALNCASVTVPGTNMTIQSDHRYGVDIPVNFVVSKSFTEITATFYESEFQNERKYLSQWMDKCIDPGNGRVNFYSDYVRDIIISQFNRKNQLTYQAKLSQAFPMHIGPMDLGYAQDNTISIMSVGFQFYKMQEVYFSQGSSSPALTFAGSLVSQSNADALLNIANSLFGGTTNSQSSIGATAGNIAHGVQKTTVPVTVTGALGPTGSLSTAGQGLSSAFGAGTNLVSTVGNLFK